MLLLNNSSRWLVRSRSKWCRISIRGKIILIFQFQNFIIIFIYLFFLLLKNGQLMPQKVCASQISWRRFDERRISLHRSLRGQIFRDSWSRRQKIGYNQFTASSGIIELKFNHHDVLNFDILFSSLFPAQK